MKNNKKIIKICLYLFFTMIIISGCWDNKDINQRNFISAMAIDKAADGKVELTLQVLRPNIIRANIEQGTKERSIWVSTTEGETIFEAVRDQLKVINRKPFYNYLRIIFIGEDLAKDGINDIIDFFIRNSEVRLIPKVIITKGMDAKKIIMADSELDNIPTLHLEGILKNNVLEAKTRDVDLIGVAHDLTSARGYGVIASAIGQTETLENIKDYKIEGTAVFLKDKLAGYLDTTETRGFLFIKDEVDSGIINVENPLEKNKLVAIEIKKTSGNMKVVMREKGIILKVDVKIRAALGEEQGKADLAREENIKKLENEIENEIKREIKRIVDLAQNKFKYDFFGFSNKVYEKYPHYWDEIKDNWEEEFSQLPLETNIKVKIDRTERIAEPIIAQ